ncbi:RNA polymerase sigma-54 factor, partial [bacterium]|nr:RNA polymerase sigma-54 factor [bacterium]
MAQAPGLQQVQRLSLQQILAPQLQQSLQLLQVSTLELQSLIQDELQQNPLIEEMPKEEPRVEVEAGNEPEDPASSKAKEDADFKEEFEVLAKLDEEWREYFSQTSSFRARSPEQEEQRQHFFDSITEQESLQQHLLSQLNFAGLTEEQRKITELLVGSINDDGYLLPTLEELSVSSGIAVPRMQEALEQVPAPE